ncbi:MAG: DMT family transporter [Anaerolineales bacterium]|nr:DMT family transporter [Anaerolineales bacterium]
MTTNPTAVSAQFEDRLVGAGLCAASAFGFATLSILAKLAFAEGLSLTGFLSLRFGGAALLLLIILGVKQGRAVFPDRRLVAILFLLGGLGYFTQSSLYFLGLQRIPASLSSVLLYIYPVFVALNMWVVEGRKPTRLEAGAMALALVGAALTASPWDALRGVGPDVLGVLLVLGAAAGYGVYIVVSNRYVHRVGPLISTAWVALGASVSFGLTGLFARTWVVPATSRAAALLLGLIVFSTILPLATFFAGMRRVGPTAASLLSTLEPVFTILLAALILHETLTRSQWAGGALILGAVVLLNLPARRAAT